MLIGACRCQLSVTDVFHVMNTGRTGGRGVRELKAEARRCAVSDSDRTPLTGHVYAYNKESKKRESKDSKL